MLTTILTLLGRSILPAALTTLVGNNAAPAVAAVASDPSLVEMLQFGDDWRVNIAATVAITAVIVYQKLRNRYKPVEAPGDEKA